MAKSVDALGSGSSGAIHMSSSLIFDTTFIELLYKITFEGEIMGETEIEETKIIMLDKRAEIKNIVEEAEENNARYPSYGGAIIAYFASDEYVRQNGRYVLKSEVENNKRNF